MTDDTISDLMDRYPEAETNSNFWLSPTWDTTKYVEKKRQHKADVASVSCCSLLLLYFICCRSISNLSI